MLHGSVVSPSGHLCQECAQRASVSAGIRPPDLDRQGPREQIDVELVEALVIEPQDDLVFLQVISSRLLWVAISEGVPVAWSPVGIDVDPHLGHFCRVRCIDRVR